jgi:hypothetical protein
VLVFCTIVESELASRGSLGIGPLGESETARRARYGTDGPAPAGESALGGCESVRVTYWRAAGRSGCDRYLCRTVQRRFLIDVSLICLMRTARIRNARQAEPRRRGPRRATERATDRTGPLHPGFGFGVRYHLPGFHCSGGDSSDAARNEAPLTQVSLRFRCTSRLFTCSKAITSLRRIRL